MSLVLSSVLVLTLLAACVITAHPFHQQALSPSQPPVCLQNLTRPLGCDPGNQTRQAAVMVRGQVLWVSPVTNQSQVTSQSQAKAQSQDESNVSP